MLIFRSIVLPQQFIDRLVGRFLPNFPLVGPLFVIPHHMVVDTRVVVVKICHLWQIFHPSVTLFQNWKRYRHIIGSCVVLPVLVQKILVVDVAQQLGVKGAQVGRHKGVFSERVVLQYFLRQFSGVPGGGLPEDEVRVDEPDIFLAEDAVVELQNLSSDELVISVDHHEDVVGFTKFHGCFFDVEESTSLVEVGLYFVPVLADFTLFLHEIFNNLCCTIRRSIVNNDDMEIRIVLHHNRTNVPESPLVFLVVEGRDDHAEGQFGVGPNLVFFLVIGKFFFGDGGGRKLRVVHGFPQLSLLPHERRQLSLFSAVFFRGRFGDVWDRTEERRARHGLDVRIFAQQPCRPTAAGPNPQTDDSKRQDTQSFHVRIET